MSGDNAGVSGSDQFVFMSADTHDLMDPFLSYSHPVDISASNNMKIEGGFMASYG